MIQPFANRNLLEAVYSETNCFVGRSPFLCLYCGNRSNTANFPAKNHKFMHFGTQVVSSSEEFIAHYELFLSKLQSVPAPHPSLVNIETNNTWEVDIDRTC